MRWPQALKCDVSLARDVLRLQGEMCWPKASKYVNLECLSPAGGVLTIGLEMR